MIENFNNADEVLDYLEALFVANDIETRGDRLPISAHMLQTAAVAAASDADGSLVAASLLHDIGHWLNKMPERTIDATGDDYHEIVGASYLKRYFGPEVTRPIELHVAAKRYLCARQADYFSTLSIGSVRSLKLQGGPMSTTEATKFEAIPEYESAIALRRWDEYGKIPGLDVPRFEHYRPLLNTLLRPLPAT